MATMFRSGNKRGDHPITIASCGVINCLLIIVTGMSYAALIFQGDLAQFIHLGVGLMFFSALVYSLVMALFSSLPSCIAEPQDIPVAILSVGAGAIGASAGADLPAESLAATVLTLIAVSSLATGLLYYLIGTFGLGNLVRYMPYPVVGGFLAGTGWLLISGGISAMADAPLGFSTLGLFFRPEALILWVPGLAFGVLLFAADLRIRHHLTAPVVILLGCLAFYAITSMLGMGVEEARSMGLLPPAIPASGFWRPPGPELLGAVKWDLILGHGLTVLAIALICSIALLLNASGMEVMARQDMHLNRELKLNGVASIVSGLGGGAPGYSSLALTAMNRALGARGRMPGIATALLCGGALFFGGQAVTLFPLPVLGGLLVYIGLGFLKEWLVDSLSHMSRTDYCLMLAILGVIGWQGFLEGVAAGFVAAVAIFVLKYSRIPIIRSRHRGGELPSDVERNPVDKEVLSAVSSRILLLRLQGYLFFGGVSQLLDPVREWLESDKEHQQFDHYAILDLGLVTGVDSSVLSSLGKLYHIPGAEKMHLAICGLSRNDQQRFQQYGHDAGRNVRYFPGRPQAIEWCEEEVLTALRKEEHPCEPGSSGEQALYCRIEDSVAHLERFEEVISSLSELLQEKSFAKGELLISQGGASNAIYFLVSGSLEAVYVDGHGNTGRVRKIMPGAMVGEMGHYLSGKGSVTVSALDKGMAWVLRGEDLDELEKTKPELALKVHKLAARMLSHRLEDANAVRESML